MTLNSVKKVFSKTLTYFLNNEFLVLNESPDVSYNYLSENSKHINIIKITTAFTEKCN